MNWYKGDIAQAVAESRAKNAIFVVYVVGNDENTEKLTKIINEDKIRSKLESENFIAICIESMSESYMQFASIYQMVPVPSIFFIGRSGTPMEIGTSVDGVEQLEEKIRKALATHNPSTHSDASSSLIASEKQATTVQNAEPSLDPKQESLKDEPQTSNPKKVEQEIKTPVEQEIVCDGDVCIKRPKETSNNEEVEQTDSKETADSVTVDTLEEPIDNEQEQARLEATRKILEQRRRRIEEEKKLEKERELQRRKEGKELQHRQEWQREQELKELKANIKRERMEEQAARERIRAQIAGDRAERAQRFNIPATDSNPTATKDEVPQPVGNTAAPIVDTVRIQFRYSGGDAQAHTFNMLDTISIVRNYVKSELLLGTGIKDFVLATAYPRHEFTGDDNERTLSDLGLFPSAVILVITKESSKSAAIIRNSGGIFNILSTIFWAMLSPVFSVFNYLKSTVVGRGNHAGGRATATDKTGAQKRSNEDSQTSLDAAKRRNLDRFMTGPSTSRDAGMYEQEEKTEQSGEQKPYRRHYGASNVHRLSDKRKDSDDENATWNGNSTQQQ